MHGKANRIFRPTKGKACIKWVHGAFGNPSTQHGKPPMSHAGHTMLQHPGSVCPKLGCNTRDRCAQTWDLQALVWDLSHAGNTCHILLSEAKDERSECKQARHALERQLSKAKGRETRLKAKLHDQNRKGEARCQEAECKDVDEEVLRHIGVKKIKGIHVEYFVGLRFGSRFEARLT